MRNDNFDSQYGYQEGSLAALRWFSEVTALEYVCLQVRVDFDLLHTTHSRSQHCLFMNAFSAFMNTISFMDAFSFMDNFFSRLSAVTIITRVTRSGPRPGPPSRMRRAGGASASLAHWQPEALAVAGVRPSHDCHAGTTSSS